MSFAETPDEAFAKAKPYFFPKDHEIRIALDKIFRSQRALLSIKHMEKAGFDVIAPQKFTRLIIARHPDLPGYIIKAYLDAQQYYKGKPEHDIWLLRIKCHP